MANRFLISTMQRYNHSLIHPYFAKAISKNFFSHFNLVHFTSNLPQAIHRNSTFNPHPSHLSPLYYMSSHLKLRHFWGKSRLLLV